MKRTRSSEVKNNFALWWRRRSMNLKKVETWELKALPQRKERRKEWKWRNKGNFFCICLIANCQVWATKGQLQKSSWWPWLIDLNTWIELKWCWNEVWYGCASGKNIMESILRREKKKGFWNELARCLCWAFLYAITRIATTTIENAIIHSYHLVSGNCSFPLQGTFCYWQ
jgi:hypothetical protein